MWLKLVAVRIHTQIQLFCHFVAQSIQHNKHLIRFVVSNEQFDLFPSLFCCWAHAFPFARDPKWIYQYNLIKFVLVLCGMLVLAVHMQHACICQYMQYAHRQSGIIKYNRSGKKKTMNSTTHHLTLTNKTIRGAQVPLFFVFESVFFFFLFLYRVFLFFFIID